MGGVGFGRDKLLSFWTGVPSDAERNRRRSRWFRCAAVVHLDVEDLAGEEFDRGDDEFFAAALERGDFSVHCETIDLPPDEIEVERFQVVERCRGDDNGGGHAAVVGVGQVQVVVLDVVATVSKRRVVVIADPRGPCDEYRQRGGGSRRRWCARRRCGFRSARGGRFGLTGAGGSKQTQNKKDGQTSHTEKVRRIPRCRHAKPSGSELEVPSSQRTSHRKCASDRISHFVR